MRIVAMHRFFPPDANPYGSILRNIVEWWREAGHDVEVIAGRPSGRPAGHDHRGVLRYAVLPERTTIGRLVNLVLFPLLASSRILLARRPPDVVMCGTMPQVTMGFFVSFAARARGATFVYHCMDLHPEAGALSGDFSNAVIFRILRWMDVWTMRRAARVVVLSPDMKRSVTRRDPRLEGKIEVLNNFALEENGVGSSDRDKAGRSRHAMRVVFTGNLGRFQGLDILIRAHACLPDDVSVELVFMGQGREREELRRLADRLDDQAVSFLDVGSPEDAAALMRTSHLGVVSLMPGVIQYAFPSKTANYLAEGLPLLIVCERDSSLVQDALKGGYGFAAEPGDVDGVRDALVAAHRAFISSDWDDVIESARDKAAREGRGSYRQQWIDLLTLARQ